jgi:DNA topoisomerase-1
MHDGKYANLESPEEVFSVGINRAVDLLAKKKTRPGRVSSSALKVLGDHPEGG